MPSRSERRREERAGRSPRGNPGELPFFRVRDVVLAAVLGAAVVTAIGAALVLSEGDDGVTPSEVVATATGTLVPFTAMTPDELAIEALARRSIEVLPAGQWPSLYADFTADYQARCPKEKFDQAGVQSSQELGADLFLLRFKRLENVSLDTVAASASADIVGEVEGGSEYVIRGAFRKVDGVWKLAPAANTVDCGAFERVSG